MLLTGTYSRSLDEKLRFSLPKPLREALGGESEPPLFVTPGTDGSLALYAESVLAALGERLEHHSPNAVDIRSFSRLFYAQAHPVELDRQGRVRIPTELVRWAGIDREITLLGVRDHLEIWERSRWQQYLESQQFRFDEIAEQVFHPEPWSSSREPAPVSDKEGKAAKPK